MAERGNRDRVVLITKGAHRRPRGLGLARTTKAYIDYDIRSSFDRLRTDHIDIWMFHRDNPNVEVAAIGSWTRAHISAQPIDVLGASNWSLDRIEAANQYAPANNLPGISLLSNHFGLATQLAPRWPGARNGDPADRARLTGLGVPNLAWSAQCGGFFASTDNQSAGVESGVRCRLRAPGQLRPAATAHGNWQGKWGSPPPRLLWPTPLTRILGRWGCSGRPTDSSWSNPWKLPA